MIIVSTFSYMSTNLIWYVGIINSLSDAIKEMRLHDTNRNLRWYERKISNKELTHSFELIRDDFYGELFPKSKYAFISE